MTPEEIAKEIMEPAEHRIMMDNEIEDRIADAIRRDRVERLPSEEEIYRAACVRVKHRGLTQRMFIEGANWLKSRLKEGS